MKKERQEIIRKLIHTPKMSFNQLWNKSGESNNFAYHLKFLTEDGLISKEDGFYSLTHEGKKLSGYLEGEDGSRAKFPILTVVCIIKKDEKYLLSQRKKEPFYEYWGSISGKVKQTDYILEAAEQEIFEETGLKCDLELAGILSSKTYNENDLSFNHQMFIIKAENPVGELIKETREGKNNNWFTIEEISKLNVIPSVPDTIKIADSKKFRWIEMDRLQEDDKFIGKKILRDIEF